MRRSLPLLSALLPAAAVLLLAACGFRGSEHASHAPGRGIAFATNGYDAALARARSERKLLMVDVYTDWCGWCRKLDEEVFSDRAVADASKEIVAVRVNAEKEGESLARRFEVEGFPTILFLDGEGQLVQRVNGYVDRDQMLKILRRLPRA